jgi:hypothetical protein
MREVPDFGAFADNVRCFYNAARMDEKICATIQKEVLSMALE